MTGTPGRCFLIRHGETAWSLAHRHTGRTDLPLLAAGRAQAEALDGRLDPARLSLVLTSPLLRARETCRLAGLDERAEVDDDLVEWDYGEYEGRTTMEILAERPGWDLFNDGAPGGESVSDVGRRADRVIERIRSAGGTVACVAHAHVLRVLAARWMGLEPSAGRGFSLDPASTSELGWERAQPVINRWNLV